jgi:uncharacterized protein
MIAVTSAMSASGQEPNWKKVSVLIYTKNGKGYIHENIPFAVTALQKLAKEKGFQAEASEDPAKFTAENLKKYSFVIFANTNNDVFDTEEQRLAFRKYMEAGGGFVGIHCVLGTERNWTWFKNMLGGTFAWHPVFQKYKINVIDASHPSVAGTPKVWEKEDECYFIKEIYPGMRVVMAHDLESLDPKEKEKEMTLAGPYNKFFPAVWYQTFDGGNVWVTTLGHDKKDYEDPIYLQHLMNGIRLIASSVRKQDYSKAYAASKDDPLR